MNRSHARRAKCTALGFLGSVLAIALPLAGGCGSSSDPGADPGSCKDAVFDVVECQGPMASRCIGGRTQLEDCGAQGKTCASGIGCVACAAGATSCDAGRAKACRADGSGYVEFECDPVQGMTCSPDGCKGSCALAAAAQSYTGCDYFPTVTLNPVWSGFSFAVAVANAGSDPAKVTVTRGGATVAEKTIAPKDLATLALPWVTELKGGDVDACQTPPSPGNTRIAIGGAYRLRSTSPVTVYQLSPLEHQLDPAPAGCPLPTQCGGPLSECLSYSNDASLLLPAPALSGDYTALSWASSPKRAGFIAVTATQNDTVVQLTGHGTFAAGSGIDANGGGKVTLAAGDVLEVLAQHDGTAGYGSDLSGTRVHASRPVQVIAGHSCANIPGADVGYCDHLEESMFPYEALGKDYLVTVPRAEVGDAPHEIRIAATAAGTHVRFDPPIVPDAVLDPNGPPLTLTKVTKDVAIYADQPIVVAQYMPGSTSLPTPVGSGDPSLSLAVPTTQFRSDYIFVAPSTYYLNFVNVIARTNSSVVLDGSPIPAGEFVPIGGSGFSVTRRTLSRADVHAISSSGPFGITVYGYGKQTSFMYPGGLDLKRVNPTPPPK